MVVSSVSTNYGVFTGANGSLRLFTVIFGALVVGLTAHSYARGEDEEEFFLISSITFLVISVTLVTLIFFGLHTASVMIIKFDFIYQAIAGVILLVGSALMLVSAINQGTPGASRFIYAERITASILGILNGFVYLCLGSNACRGPESVTVTMDEKFDQVQERRTSTTSITRIV